MYKNNLDKILETFKKVHGNLYDYTHFQYKDNRTKTKIICRKHGDFYQSYRNHSKGHGCPDCSNNRKMNTLEFTKKAVDKWGNRYDYSLVNYINSKMKIKIICKDHGIFDQTPAKHLSGRGCHICGCSNRLSNSDFIRKALLVHENKYDYSLVNYKNAFAKVKIICKEHGEFLQRPNNHLSGYGCFICKSSKGEIKIFNFLKNNNFNFIQEYYLPKINCYLDFFIPNLNIAIEYDGIQHFESVDYFGGKKVLLETKNRDKIKDRYCIDNNIYLGNYIPI